MKADDIKIEREIAFTDDWYMVRKMDKTPTYADAIEWADQNPKWIKVTDRLPKINTDVLLVFKRHGEDEYFSTVGYLEYRQIKGLKTVQWNPEYEEDDMLITHWMPIILPKED